MTIIIMSRVSLTLRASSSEQGKKDGVVSALSSERCADHCLLLSPTKTVEAGQETQSPRGEMKKETEMEQQEEQE
jgi:hypothetical protein